MKNNSPVSEGDFGEKEPSKTDTSADFVVDAGVKGTSLILVSAK